MVVLFAFYSPGWSDFTTREANKTTSQKIENKPQKISFTEDMRRFIIIYMQMVSKLFC